MVQSTTILVSPYISISQNKDTAVYEWICEGEKQRWIQILGILSDLIESEILTSFIFSRE
jgi:hypothetical protein